MPSAAPAAVAPVAAEETEVVRTSFPPLEHLGAEGMNAWPWVGRYVSLGEAEGEDRVQREARVLRRGREAQDHPRGQGYGPQPYSHRGAFFLSRVIGLPLTFCSAISFCSHCYIQAKKFVESLPKVLKENLSKEDAEKLKKTFTDLGATVALE